MFNDFQQVNQLMAFEIPYETALHQFIGQAAMEPECRVRLAPTPSGFLHTGNVLNFIFNALAARLHPSGHVLLRIDDLDADRKRPEYISNIFGTLEWLGIGWDEGPCGPDDFEKNWSQKHFLPEMETALANLVKNNAVFACRKSRKDLSEFNGQYPESFRNQGLSLCDEEVIWRASTPPGFPLPCFVVRKRDLLPAYQAASVCMDVRYQITHIIRGKDLQDSTNAQQWLAPLAGLGDFNSIKIYHHELVTDSPGHKLSKSAGAAAALSDKDLGVKSAIFFQMAAKWLGLPEKNLQNLSDLVALFKDNQK